MAKAPRTTVIDLGEGVTIKVRSGWESDVERMLMVARLQGVSDPHKLKARFAYRGAGTMGIVLDG